MTSPSPAIADTSALSALCRIGRLEILRWRFPLVIVPHAVRMELEAADDRDLIDLELLRQALTAVGEELEGP